MLSEISNVTNTVNSKYSEVNTEINELNEVAESAKITLYIDSEQFTVTGYLKTDGSVKELSGFICTDFIETLNGELILSGSLHDVDPALPNICLYDDDKNFISCIKLDFDGVKVIRKKYDLKNAKYIRIVTSLRQLDVSFLRLTTATGIHQIDNSVRILTSAMELQDKRIENIENVFVEKKEKIAQNYNTYAISSAMSPKWYGVGSEVIIPNNSAYIGIETKVDGDTDVLVEMLENDIVTYSSTEHVNTADKILFFIPCINKDGKTVVVRISTPTSGRIHLLNLNGITYSEYAVRDACYAKSDSSWGKYTLVQFSVPVLFFTTKKVIDVPTVDIKIHKMPTIYTIQFSDDMQRSPSLGIYVDSVINGKQDVSFDGIDRAYLSVPNKTQTNDIAEITESFTLSGNGYNDKTFNVKNISIKTSNLANKTAKVLQIGDSVTHGAGSQYNTDDKPQRSWAYLAYLGKKYLSSYEQLGKVVSETITLADGSSYTAKAEGRGGWKLYDYMYVADKTVDGVNLVNPFYNANKVWTKQELNTKGVKFSLAYYLSQTGVETPTHVVLQLGFNDAASDNFVENMGLIIEAIKEEYPNMIIGISHIRDYGIFYQKYYPNLVPNASCWHNGLYDKMSDRVEQIMEMEDVSNSVYFIPTYFISPTGDSIPTYRIDDKDVAFRVDSTYHPNHKAHVEWGKEMFAWLAYTLLK